MKKVLEQYRERTGGEPLRVALRKTSKFDEREVSGERVAGHTSGQDICIRLTRHRIHSKALFRQKRRLPHKSLHNRLYEAKPSREPWSREALIHIPFLIQKAHF